MRARFFAPAQTDSGAHPSTHTVITGSFPEAGRAWSRPPAPC